MTLDASGRLLVGTTSTYDFNGQANLVVTGTSNNSTLTIASATDGYIAFADGTTGTDRYSGMIQYSHASDYMAFRTVAIERMRLDSSGNLGLGVTPSASSWVSLELLGGNVITSFASASIPALYSASNAFYNSGWKYKTTNNALMYAINANSGQFQWFTAPSGTAGNAITFTQAMTLDASGNLGIGTSSPAVKLQVNNATTVGTGASAMSGISPIVFADNGSATNGSFVIKSHGVGNGNVIGAYRIATSPDGTNYSWAGMASITSANSAADTLAFYTAASNSSGATSTERMRIDASGNLGIGTTSSLGNASRLSVQVDGSFGAVAFARNTDNTFAVATDYYKSRGSAASPTAVQNGDDVYQLRSVPYQGSAYTYLNSMIIQIDGTYTSGQNPPTRISWYTNTANGSATERARIDSSGNLLVGATTNAPAGTQAQIVNKWSGGSKWGASFDQTVSSSTQYTHINFSTNGTTVGYINANNSVTTYNSVSDYRLKTVIGAVSGSGERIDALEPIEYEWKVDGSRTRGFLAHKFQEVYSGSVSGDKDAVDAEGNPVYQAMQAATSEVIADLVAEIQSLRKRLAILEAK
jgi:hypothetical protein